VAQEEPDLRQLEAQLDGFSAATRREARQALSDRKPDPRVGTAVNLHAHTFFSYNAYGYSPSSIAWRARKAGWAVAGIVDFDVLDGLEEFHAAASLLGVKACVGMETRVFIPEFAKAEINSPGEPGIAYHLGVGFPTPRLEGRLAEFAAELRDRSAQRNRELVARVNQYLAPVALDYDAEVLPLTPNGNATERHVCLAYARQARRVFTREDELRAYWSERLGERSAALGTPALEEAIRAKTMKQGGVGYVRPDSQAFPRLEETNQFLLAAGAIPTYPWLDGTTEGETRIEELLQVAVSTGVAAINIIPDRNYRPGMKDEKLANLHRVVALAEELHLPVVVGTEMNSPGQKLVDAFDSEELTPLARVFLKGAHIVYAHAALQRGSGLGYTSEWARQSFADVAERNHFFETLGRALRPAQEAKLNGLPEDVRPEAVLARAEP